MACTIEALGIIPHTRSALFDPRFGGIGCGDTASVGRDTTMGRHNPHSFH